MNMVQVCPKPFRALGGPAKTYRQFFDTVGARAIGFSAPTDGVGESAVVPLAASVRTLGGKIARYYYAPDSRLREAETKLAAADFVLLHGLFTHPPVWAARVCQRLKVPYAVALHGILDPWALQRSSLAKRIWLGWYGKRILGKASAVICATRREAEKAAPVLPAGDSVRVIRWACEVPPVDQVLARREALRRHLGFNNADRVLVFLGRLHSMKRPVETVRLLGSLGLDNLKLLVVGPDDDVSRVELEAEAGKLGWSGLRVVGPVFGEERFAYLGAGDGFISLSHRENFNYALSEAMAAGLPAIISPGNDLGWEFADEGFSWQLKTGEPAEIRRTVGEFSGLGDGELRHRGGAAREWVRKNLSLAHLQQQLNNLAGSTPWQNVRGPT